MLSIKHPEIIHYLDFPAGLMPLFLPRENKYALVIKANKEIILTAKNNSGFKIFLLDDVEDKAFSLGIMAAFFDDHDEPLIIATPLFAGDQMLDDVTGLLSQNEFEIYFFDENNRELFGSKTINKDHKRFKEEILKSSFHTFAPEKTLSIWQKMGTRFGIRDNKDNEKAFALHFTEELYPSDFIITDIREQYFGYNDSQKTVAITSLIRDDAGGPGAQQERDIALLMRRIYEKENIYLNPHRVDNNKELVDLLIVTERIMLFIQAKDSPNTQENLSKPIDKKKKAIRSHINKAASQIYGALRYAHDNDGVEIKTVGGDSINIPLSERRLVGLVVVKELFDDDYPACSAPVLAQVRKLELPIALLDYSQLHILTYNLKQPTHFINALYDILDVALEHEQFPKSVWSQPPQ